MGAHARGIGSRGRWPCVGDPDQWDAAGTWHTCAAEGALSLLALVPAGSVRADVRPEHDEPVLVHVTCCKTHVRGVRRWLQGKTFEPVDTFGTEVVMREWGQIEESMQGAPVLRMVAAG